MANLVEVFEDSMNWIAENSELKKFTEYSVSHTELYPEGKTPEIPENLPEFQTKMEVLPQKSFETAIQLRKQYPGARIAVHNFASATNPGGGVTNGSRAQEESLCRCSNLYPCLNQGWLKQDYYLFHRNRHDLRYTDACIWSPDVMIFKTDTSLPERMPQADWCKVDILTCAAPNLRRKPYNAMNPGKGGSALQLIDQELGKLHYKRAKHLLSVALAHHVEILVLGAFGCGAFQNNPYVVAQAYRKVLNELEFKNKFCHITFAVYTTPRDRENFKAFEKYFS
ncbi:MAG: TIGR02452 family protein [Oscillospiraceae bacterium]|nr:TIGR02452 family protein [Oscillospiraceae bacterium]